MATERMLPVGIQNFEKLRDLNAVYVDKTDLIFDLTTHHKYVFLSRPRRFGKSLLSSTLDYYFQGRKDLFAGLAIEQLEKHWTAHPVLHFDLSTAKGKSLENTIGELDLQLAAYEKTYGRVEAEVTPGQRLNGLIVRAHEQSGRKVVLLFDEYDAPLLDIIHDEEYARNMRSTLQDLYSPIKKCDGALEFVFITGITKFSQVSIFSELNNLSNISRLPQFASLCGISESEVSRYLQPEISRMAEKLEVSEKEVSALLKEKYDGYHFSEEMEDIYNPFSLLKALQNKELDNYWFESGTPTFLIRQMKRFKTDLSVLDTQLYTTASFDVAIETMRNALPLLYQTGYITIKRYDADRKKFQLGIPNNEVRVGLMESLLPMYAPTEEEPRGMAMDFCYAIRHDDVEEALGVLRSFLASIPYPEADKALLQEQAHYEAYYSRLFYILFSMFCADLRTEVRSARGRTDMVMFTRDTIYVFEFKVNASADEALAQINGKGYAIPYEADGRRVVKIGVRFSSETRTIEEWKMEC